MARRTWHWAFSLFRAADGATVVVIPLMVAIEYGRGIAWVAGVFALMNITAVPAGILWARIMSRGRWRRRLAMAGFVGAAAALLGMAMLPPFPVFVALAMLFTISGLATAPAAGVLAIEGVPQSGWGEATGALSRHTGVAYLLGTALAVTFGLSGIAMPWVFLIAAVSSVGASLVAARTIPPYSGPPRPVAGYQRDAALRGQSRFERYVWFPSRLRNGPWLPSLRTLVKAPATPLLVGIFLVFAGTLMVLASYPGVLVEHLGLGAALVLVGQAPSFLASSVTYAPAGRMGDRVGLVKATRVGLLLRLAVVPALAAALLWWGAAGFVAILVLHALLGVTFAFLSVNGPCLAAELQPTRQADAVGWFHAAVAAGVMAGALLSTVMLVAFSLAASYLVAVLVLSSGTLLMFRVPARL